MAHLLHLDASPRNERSHSRRLSKEFIEAWKKVHLTDSVTYRDLGRNPVPHVDEQWIAAAFSSPEKHTLEMSAAIQLSDQLIDEFLASDIYVLGIPMYNFSIPSTFKAYIDQIVRVGRTFAFTPEDPRALYKPLIHGKKMFIIAVRGSSGYAPGGYFEGHDHQTPYLKTVFGFLGIRDITFIYIENEEFGDERLVQSIAAAQKKITELTSASRV